MNTTSVLLVVLLSGQGYWFGGQNGTISARWAAVGGLPPAELSWELLFGNVSLAKGQVPLEPNQTARVDLKPPGVRTRTLLRWTYVVRQREGGQEITRGDLPIHVFADDLLSGLDERLAGRKLFVWDRAEDLPGLLDAAKIGYTRVKAAADLQLPHADIVLVGPDQLEETPFSQVPLLDQASAGAQVFVFRQARVSQLAGYALARRDVPTEMGWRSEYPLLNQLTAKDLESWLRGLPDVTVVQLPADEPALEIAYWPREVEGREPSPIDALLVSKAIGSGRIVLCQLPLGDWRTDPRSRILLRNALDYLMTRPEPTPRPSERRTRPMAVPRPVPTVAIPGGARP